MLLGQLAADHAQFQGDQREALAFDPGDHFTDQTTADTVGLDQDQRALTHGGSFLLRATAGIATPRSLATGDRRGPAGGQARGFTAPASACSKPVGTLP